MKFIVYRVSSEGTDDKPCDEAKKELIPEWEVRTLKEEDFNRKFSKHEGLWRSQGKNHSITKEGYITRQMRNIEEWTIEINALQEMINFSEKYGNIILRNSWEHPEYKVIEIYDDYRE